MTNTSWIGTISGANIEYGTISYVLLMVHFDMSLHTIALLFGHPVINKVNCA